MIDANSFTLPASYPILDRTISSLSLSISIKNSVDHECILHNYMSILCSKGLRYCTCFLDFMEVLKTNRGSWYWF